MEFVALFGWGIILGIVGLLWLGVKAAIEGEDECKSTHYNDESRTKLDRTHGTRSAKNHGGRLSSVCGG